MSPNCECGHERGDHGPKMWGCAHCPCTEYEARTPATSPTPSASPEADGRCDGENYTRTTSGSRQWIDCRVCGEFEVVPKSELARVQRERDEAMDEMMHWNRESVRLENECATLRAQLASALDAARKELQSAQRDLDAALDRARVAEQRIETGEIRWRDKSGTYLLSDPSGWRRAARELYGPFTRGRFVADMEET